MKCRAESRDGASRQPLGSPGLHFYPGGDALRQGVTVIMRLKSAGANGLEIFRANGVETARWRVSKRKDDQTTMDPVNSSRPPDHPLAGIYEEYQGPWDFGDLDSYVKQWVKPNILGDLDTVFVGTRQLWEQRNPRAGSPGRGDFSMATALMSVMDHLGACLVESPDHWIGPSDNIARVAKHLRSTWDIFAIIAEMGRHALVHGAWPQTAVPFEAWRPVTDTNGPMAMWAFGLSFNANSSPLRHDTLHATKWPHDNITAVKVAPDAMLLKLVLNVQMLRWELLEFVDSGTFKSKSPVGANRETLMT